MISQGRRDSRSRSQESRAKRRVTRDERIDEKCRTGRTRKPSWFACTFNVAALRVAFVPIEWEKTKGRKRWLSRRVGKTSDGAGQRNRDGAFLGVLQAMIMQRDGRAFSLLFAPPPYRPIGGCCYLRLVTSLHPSICS